MRRSTFPLLLLAVSLGLQGCPTPGMPSVPATPRPTATPTAGATASPTPAAATPTPVPSSGPSEAVSGPPAGFSVILPGVGVDGVNGEAISMVLDAHDDPIIAYADNTENSGFPIYVVAWDRAGKRWKEPVRVGRMGTSGALGGTSQEFELALARDADTGRLGVLYAAREDGGPRLHLAVSSDEGATWASEELARASDGVAHLQHVALLLEGGRQHVAYSVMDDDLNDLRYWTRTGTSGAFAQTVVPFPADVPRSNGTYFAPALAQDASGNVAMAFATDGFPDGEIKNPTRKVMAFWRPGQAVSRTIHTGLAAGTSWDKLFPSLAFDGTRPRVVFTGVKAGEDAVKLWSAASEDGLSWQAPVEVPQDGSDWWEGATFAIDAQGRGAIASGANGGSGDACGWPKLARTTDFATWSTCSPDADNSKSLDGKWPVIRFTQENKVMMAFFNGGRGEPAVKEGLVLWREP